MKKIQFLGLALLVSLVSFQAVASAKTVSGKVATIDAASNKVSVSYTDPSTSKEEKAEISVKPETTYSGVASLGELKEGQEVSVDAEEDAATGGWSAISIKAAEAQPAL